MSAPLACEWHDVQGIVSSGYRRMPFARYVFLTLTDVPAARRWLARHLGAVTHASGRHEHAAVNLAFSYEGLSRWLAPAPLAHVPLAFQEGMATGSHRRRLLGDLGEHAPEHWQWGGPGTPRIDLLLMVFDETADGLAAHVNTLLLDAAGFSVAGMLDSHRASDREPFGFMDGLSQPLLEGTRAAIENPDSLHRIRLGEVLLGYPDNADVTMPYPSVDGCPEFGLNGTFLVARQLAQDVDGFWAFMNEAAAAAGLSPREVAEKMMGRTLDGDPLTPDRAPHGCAHTNEFGFAGHDMRGEGCPIGSHIRRGNPRDTLSSNPTDSWRNTNRHRLLRRGRPYGAPGQPRGLMFLVLNADIERQFEFIQANWINDNGFGELRRERDPIIGWRTGDDDTFTIPAKPLRRRVHGMRTFVTPRGGGYFFLPGLRALAFLAR